MSPRRAKLLRSLCILALGVTLLAPGIPVFAQGGGVQDAVTAFAAAARSGSAVARRAPDRPLQSTRTDLGPAAYVVRPRPKGHSLLPSVGRM